MINRDAALVTVLSETAVFLLALAIYGAYRLCRDLANWADNQRRERAWLKAIEQQPTPAPEPFAPYTDGLEHLFTELGPPTPDLDICRGIWPDAPKGDQP